MNYAFKAWAINTGQPYSNGQTTYLGRYYWGDAIPRHMEGCVIALFKTRKLARETLAQNKIGYNPYPKSHVSRVNVIIQEAKKALMPLALKSHVAKELEIINER